MPCTSLVNLVFTSNPTFLSLSGNLNIHTAWTEYSLASWLQLVCSLAGWQLPHCSALVFCSQTIPFAQKAPVAPSGAPNRCSYYWVQETGNPSSETSTLCIAAVAALTGDEHLTWDEWGKHIPALSHTLLYAGGTPNTYWVPHHLCIWGAECCHPFHLLSILYKWVLHQVTRQYHVQAWP